MYFTSVNVSLLKHNEKYIKTDFAGFNKLCLIFTKFNFNSRKEFQPIADRR